MPPEVLTCEIHPAVVTPRENLEVQEEGLSDVGGLLYLNDLGLETDIVQVLLRELHGRQRGLVIRGAELNRRRRTLLGGVGVDERLGLGGVLLRRSRVGEVALLAGGEQPIGRAVEAGLDGSDLF